MTAIRGTFIITCDEVIRVADAQLIAWFKKSDNTAGFVATFCKIWENGKGLPAEMSPGTPGDLQGSLYSTRSQWHMKVKRICEWGKTSRGGKKGVLFTWELGAGNLKDHFRPDWLWLFHWHSHCWEVGDGIVRRWYFLHPWRCLLLSHSPSLSSPPNTLFFKFNRLWMGGQMYQ